MRYGLFLIACVLFVLIAPLPATPTNAQNPLATGACGLGQYWLVQDDAWDAVWMRQGSGSTFFVQQAFWMTPDTSATLSIDMQGDSVFISRADNPNIFGTLSCMYEGTVRPDGVSVVGSSVCELETGTSFALSWSAAIVCGTPLITWHDTAFSYRAAKGNEFSFECPPDGFAAPIWGTPIYIEGSSICTAGVHAGVITFEDGGLVTIEILPGEASYPGGMQNGVVSNEFPTAGQFDASFVVVGGQQPQSSATPTPTATQTATPTATTSAAPDGVAGTWITDVGVTEFSADGVATYDDAGATSHIYFEYEDSHTITGYWVEADALTDCGVERNGSRYWGRIRFVFNEDFSLFTGTWSYCDAELGSSWGGKRAE